MYGCLETPANPERIRIRMVISYTLTQRTPISVGRISPSFVSNIHQPSYGIPFSCGFSEKTNSLPSPSFAPTGILLFPGICPCIFHIVPSQLFPVRNPPSAVTVMVNASSARIRYTNICAGALQKQRCSYNFPRFRYVTRAVVVSRSSSL